MNQFLRLFAAISLLFGSVLPSSQAQTGGTRWAMGFNAYAQPKALDYAEEQEWRLVMARPESHGAHPFVAGARWLPVKPGEQLQVLVVPDNVLYQRVLADRELMQLIAPEKRKPIQVISWESIRRI